MNILNDKEINKILSNEHIKINGIFQKDKIKSLTTGFYIINLQSSIQGNGTHWCSLYFNPIKSIWFDSYGFKPPLEIERLLNEYDYNSFEIQGINNSSCGYYAIAMIKFLYDKKDKINAYKTFINLFKKNTINNENILYNLLYL